jgi:ribosomal protein L18E
LQQRIFNEKISQSVFSRFMVSKFNWQLFNLKRIAKFQENEETRLVDGDVIALDDSLHHCTSIGCEGFSRPLSLLHCCILTTSFPH